MAKEIFHTTEKSNFILNMTEEKYSQLASYGLLGAMFLAPLFTLIPEIADNSGLYAMAAGGLAVAGVACMVLALISAMKNYIKGKLIVPCCAFAALFIWAIVSVVDSYDITISIYGFTGRGEGILAILFYFSFFVTALSIKREQAMNTIITGLVGVGLLHSLIGIIQIITGEPGEYKRISSTDEIYAASGLAQSPLFLAMVLTAAMIAAMVGFVRSSSKKQRTFFIVSTCVMSFVMMFTYSFIGICGLVLAVLMGVISVFSSKAPKKRLASVFAVILPACAAFLIVQAGIIGNVDGYSLHDGKLLWWADGYFRISASGMPDSDKVDIDDTFDVYYKLNDRTKNIISTHALTGTGPDQLVLPQLYTNPFADDPEKTDVDLRDIIEVNNGTFDKVYNEYLYTAATRGIPSLVALIAVLLSAVAVGITNLKRKVSWTFPVLFAVTVGGILIFFIVCSNIAYSPIFWTAAGASCAEIMKNKPQTEAAAKKTADTSTEKATEKTEKSGSKNKKKSKKK